MPSIPCYTCNTEILTYEEGEAAPSFVVLAPGAPVPGGNHVVHVCPQQIPYVAQRRPSDSLDWTDEQERAAVSETLPKWKLLPDDEIFCMRWYNPGWGRPEVPSGPFTVQVRRNGVDLKYATQGADFDEVTFTAAEAAEIVARLGFEPWPGLAADIEAEKAAAAAAVDERRRRLQSANASAKVWADALAEVESAIEQATAAVEADPKDGAAGMVLHAARVDFEQIKVKAAEAAATAAAIAREK